VAGEASTLVVEAVVAVAAAVAAAGERTAKESLNNRRTTLRFRSMF
jgi:hypothetical protein